MVEYTPFSGFRQAMLRQVVDEATRTVQAPANLSKLLENAFENFDSIRSIVYTVARQPEKSPPRSLIGMAIRSRGATWTTQVTYVMLAEFVYEAQTSSYSGFGESSPLSDEPLRARYSAFANFVWVKRRFDEVDSFRMNKTEMHPEITSIYKKKGKENDGTHSEHEGLLLHLGSKFAVNSHIYCNKLERGCMPEAGLLKSSTARPSARWLSLSKPPLTTAMLTTVP